MKPHRKLRALVARLVAVCRDYDSLDGGELLDWLVEAGVLTAVVVNERCGDRCRCCEYDAEPPWTCYRISEAFK